MALHLIFFLSVLAFLSGIAFSSLGLPFLFIIIPAAVLFAALFYFGAGAKVSILAAVILIAGSFYYFWTDYNYQSLAARLPPKGETQGMIVSAPKIQDGRQSFYLKTAAGKILVETGAEPIYSYGDTLSVSGAIKTPPQSYYGKYLAKEGVAGIMNNPRANFISSGGGSEITASLLKIRGGVVGSFKKLLSSQEASFLAGITLGINSEIPKELARNLSSSGLRYLTAIDGLHMAIVIFIISIIFLYTLPRRYAFILTFIFVCLFTALTGFSVSAVRASLMAFVAALAKENGRLYAPHNALALTALILVLFNPKILVFDIGFQLSFLAVISIIYFMPVLRDLLKLDNSSGFLKWKELLLITISAQLMTAPILITQFKNFSLLGFIASVPALIVVPYVIGLGLLMGLFYFIFIPLASVISLIVAPLLDYLIFIVNVFAKFAVKFNPDLGFVGMAVYYGIIVLLMYHFYGRRSAKLAVQNNYERK
ncbi:MAG: ComEC family competence protein [Patescibacteria group bacterium]|nr:ComEC family competence protein [Patescibacteria group bacterium]